MTTLLLGIVCASLLWLIGCTFWSILRPERRLWPPVGEPRFVQRVNGVLGPGTNLGIVVLAFLGWDSFVFQGALRFLLAGLLLAGGAYFGLGGFLSLGGERSLGGEGELQESGAYRFSRNPQYVGAVLSFAGLCVVSNSAPALLATALASVLLLSMPFAEEPWLRERLGGRYADYVARVPRYLGRRRTPADRG